jgi:two-component system chemotaxis response regulator CheY
MPVSPKPITAMVVDDERYFRRFVGELLHSQGIAQTVEAKDGSEALQLFPVVKPSLVVLDINMPRTDGLEVLRGIRAQAPDVPVVMLTSIADEMVVEKCVDEGATYFIRKDVPAQDLSRELRELVREFLEDSETQQK